MPDTLRQFVEWYLGVPPRAESEATQWRIRTAEWAANTPEWAMWLVGIVVVLGVLLVYRRDAQRVSPGRRWSLIALRLGTLALMAVLLVQVTLSIDRVGLPLVAVLIDTSGSMRFQDDYVGTDDAPAVASLTRPDEPANRLQLAKNLLTDPQVGLLADTAGRFRVRVYEFDADSEPVRTGTNAPEEQRAAIASLEADGQRTALAASTKSVLQELRSQALAAVVVLTDGISTEGDAERLSSIIPTAKRANTAIHVVGVGSAKAAKDIEITAVSADEIAIVDQTMVFAGEVHATGFKGRDVVLELRDAKTRRRLAAKSVRLAEEQQPVELGYTPTAVGEFDLTFGIVQQEEEQVVANNFETRHVSVRAGRIRVLLVDRLPRYEFRYIKHLLEREDTAGVFDLETILLDADPEWTAIDQSASKIGGRLPTTAALINRYDVVIVGDIDPDLLSASAQTAWRDYVRENGGGVVLIAGPKHNPGSFRGSQLEPLFPLQLDRVSPTDFRRTTTVGVRSQPTLTGRQSTRLFRFGSNPTATARVVAEFPPLRSVLKTDGLAAGASVLVSGTTDGEANEVPLVIAQQYGAGRVVFQATDDLWMWRRRSGDDTHGRYWLALMRYLARSRILGRDRAAVLTTDREIYEAGEAIEFSLRFRDARRQPENRVATVTAERVGGLSEAVQLSPSAEDSGTYTGTLTLAEPGSWHAWTSFPAFDGVPPSADFRVQATGRELLVRDMDQDSLIATSRATRGHFYTLGTANQLPNRLPRGRATVIERGRPIEIWNRAELMLLITSLLALEWFLRKSARLV